MKKIPLLKYFLTEKKKIQFYFIQSGFPKMKFSNGYEKIFFVTY